METRLPKPVDLPIDRHAGPAENLTPGAAAKRLRYSVGFLAAALLGAVALHHLAASWWWRLALGVPFSMSANGFYQGLYRL